MPEEEGNQCKTGGPLAKAVWGAENSEHAHLRTRILGKKKPLLQETGISKGEAGVGRIKIQFGVCQVRRGLPHSKGDVYCRAGWVRRRG